MNTASALSWIMGPQQIGGADQYRDSLDLIVERSRQEDLLLRGVERVVFGAE